MNIDNTALVKTFVTRPHLVIVSAEATIDTIQNKDIKVKRRPYS